MSSKSDETREWCKPYTSNAFSALDLKKATKISWWEKIALYFVKEEVTVDDIECHTLKFKTWRGKTCVISHRLHQREVFNCRHEVTYFSPEQLEELKNRQPRISVNPIYWLKSQQ